MVLRRPGVNRSLNRENPDILIVMIAEQQMMRGGEEDKGGQSQREGMGPLKPATEMSGTAPRSNVFLSLFLFSAHLFLLVWLFFLSLSELNERSIFMHLCLALCRNPSVAFWRSLSSS